MLIRNKCLNPVSLPFVSGSDLPIFRCGKCPNCLKHKASEMSVRVLRECKGRSVAFLTFTYEDRYLPFQVNRLRVDASSGEVLQTRSFLYDSRNQSSSALALRNLFFSSADYTTVFRFDKKVKRMIPVKRYKPLSLDRFSDEFVEVENFVDSSVSLELQPLEMVTHKEIYFTLDYNDIKRTLKRFRSKCDKDFSIYVVPEYGGAGYRPHFHALVIGLDYTDSHVLADCWRVGRGKNSHLMGDVQVKFLDASDPDAVGCISSYLVKYATKGQYDCPYIFSGNCSKPRCGISQNFGVGSIRDFNQLASQILRWDLYGRYIPSEIDSDFLNRIDPDALAAYRVVWVNELPYPVPRYLYQKIMSEKVYQTEIVYCPEYVKDRKYSWVAKPTKMVYKSTLLQKKVADSLLRRAIEDATRELEKAQALFKGSSDPFQSIDSYFRSNFPDLASYESEFRRSIEQDSVF